MGEALASMSRALAQRRLAMEHSTNATRRPRVLLVGRGMEPFASASWARTCRSATSRRRDAMHCIGRSVTVTVTIARHCYSLHANQAASGVYSSASLVVHLF